MTATPALPSQFTAILNGGAGLGPDEIGMITTVRRLAFTKSIVTTTHGRVLAISEPTVGSNCTHHTSPRSGFVPRILIQSISAQCFHIPFQLCNIRIRIQSLARRDELLIARTQLAFHSLSNPLGALLRWHHS